MRLERKMVFKFPNVVLSVFSENTNNKLKISVIEISP